MVQVDQLSSRGLDRGRCRVEVERFMRSVFGVYPDVRKIWSFEGRGCVALGFKQKSDLYRYFDPRMLSLKFMVYKEDKTSVILKTREVLDRYVERRIDEVDCNRLSFTLSRKVEARRERLMGLLADRDREDVVRESMPQLFKGHSMGLDEMLEKAMLSDVDREAVEDLYQMRESIYKGSEGDGSKCFCEDLEDVMGQSTDTNRLAGEWKLNQYLKTHVFEGEVDRNRYRDYLREEYLPS